MKDIIKLIKYTDISYMKRQIGCMIFLLLNTVLTLVYPSCISVIVDQGVAKGSIEDIIKYSILMFVLGILIMITNYDEIEKFLREKHFTVQISVDGNKDVHNCNRFYANGLGSFDVMEKNTRNMRNDGLVSGRATITATNLDLVDNFKALNDMKFRSIPMAPAQNLLSDEDYDRLIGENTKLVQYFLELIQSGDYKTAKKLRILMSGLQKIHKSGVARKILCGVGSAQLAVDINGEIYPCHRFVANKEYAMGNVLKDTKIEKMPFLEEITLEKHKECKNCWARNLCVGACPNENLVNAGTTQKSDSKNCRFIQAMYNDLIHAYLELTVENKKQLLG